MEYSALADLYERQYEGYRDDLAFYARLAERLGAGRVLELGAGAGRVAVALARRGLAVTGLEPSGAMIERGRTRASREGAEVQWVQGDMRDFSLGETWPLVIAPFNALMHLYTLEDQDRALARVAAHLEPGGTFALDLYGPRFGLHGQTGGLMRHEGETFFDPNGSRTDVLVHQRVDAAAQLARTTYFVDRIAPGGALSREVLELVQRYYTRFELERLLRGAGFRPEFSGDFEGARLEADSPSMVVVARWAG